jgi:hypothetical protein
MLSGVRYAVQVFHVMSAYKFCIISLSVSEVEESAAKLIAKDRLPARIDSQSKVMRKFVSLQAA